MCLEDGIIKEILVSLFFTVSNSDFLIRIQNVCQFVEWQHFKLKIWELNKSKFIE